MTNNRRLSRNDFALVSEVDTEFGPRYVYELALPDSLTSRIVDMNLEYSATDEILTLGGSYTLAGTHKMTHLDGKEKNFLVYKGEIGSGPMLGATKSSSIDRALDELVEDLNDRIDGLVGVGRVADSIYEISEIVDQLKNSFYHAAISMKDIQNAVGRIYGLATSARMSLEGDK